MMERNKNLTLEDVIDKTFEEGYEYKLDGEKREYVVKEIFSFPQFQNAFQDPYFLNYLANPLSTSLKFDLNKTLTLLEIGDEFFESHKMDKEELTHNLSLLIPKLFFERIRYPFVCRTHGENEEKLRKGYNPKWLTKPEGGNKRPLDLLRQHLAFGLSTSEGKMARMSHSNSLKRQSVNFSLSALKHSSEACIYGFLKKSGYFGYVGNYFSNFAKRVGRFRNKQELINSLVSEHKEDLENISHNLEEYSQLVEYLKINNSLSQIRQFCLERARDCYENFFKSVDRDKKTPDLKHTCELNLGFLGETYFRLAGYQQKVDLNSSLESFVSGIVCCELSKNLGNDENLNYQMIGRGYYALQSLVERANRKQIGDITIKIITDKIKKVLYEKNSLVRRISEKYKGRLCDIIDFGDNLVNRLGEKMQFIALESSYKAFELSYNDGKGDSSLDNRSYRGMCLTDLVRLNNRLNKFDRQEARKKLEEAEGLLKSVLLKRLRNKRKGKEHRGLYKDYRRLSGCQFHLANEVEDIEEKKKLYQRVIRRNKKASKLLLLRNRNRDENREVYSFIAASHYKLAEISSDVNEKKQNLEKAVEYFDDAFDAGDKSPENRSKKGGCYLGLLDLILKEERSEEEIKELISETKQTLEKAVNINDSEQGSFVYPKFLLALLVQRISQKNKGPKEYGLKSPSLYLNEAFQTYSEKNPHWHVEQVGKSKNYVYESLDNYGLLDSIFLLKQGDKDDLEKEKDNTERLSKKLEEKLRGSRKFLAPMPHSIIYHEDKNPDLSGHFYVMSRKNGVTLDDYLKDERKTENEKSEVLTGVVDYLAFIHANLKGGPDEQDYMLKLREKLDKLEELGIVDSSIKTQIISNYSPILESFHGATLVFNKDAHPRNWIITPNKRIVAVDLEDKLGNVPIEFDLVNLLGYVDFNSRRDFIDNYRESFEKYSGKKYTYDEKVYLNAFIHQAFSVIALQAAKGRSMYPPSIVLLNKALNSVQIILQQLGLSEEFSKNYRKIYEGFKKIKGALEIDANQRSG